MVLCLCLTAVWGPQTAQAKGFALSSPAFRDADKIGKQFACDGADHSPPLAFAQPPAGTKSLAVLMTEVDAPKGNATLWIVYNLPPNTAALAENQGRSRTLKGDALQLSASNGKMGYSGPCPQSGITRRFVIEAFALNTTLDLPETATRRDFLLAVEGHILARAKLSGKYKK